MPDQWHRLRRRGAEEPRPARQAADLCTALRDSRLTFCGLPPGIGSFTIVDGATVSEADLGNNFFVEQTSLGTSRAACVTRLLQELNEHVTGSYVAEDISQARRPAPARASAAVARDTPMPPWRAGPPVSARLPALLWSRHHHAAPDP